MKKLVLSSLLLFGIMGDAMSMPTPQFIKDVRKMWDCRYGGPKAATCTKQERIKSRNWLIASTVTVLLTVLAAAGITAVAVHHVRKAKQDAEKEREIEKDGFEENNFEKVQNSLAQLKRDIDTFVQNVRKNVTKPALANITFDQKGIEQLETMIQNASLGDAQKKVLYPQIEALKKNVQELMFFLEIQTKRKDTNLFYRETRQNLEESFDYRGTDFKKLFGFTLESIYPFLGIRNNEGKQKTAASIRQSVNEKEKALKNTGKYQDNQIYELGRQLGYIFNREDQKKLYDALLGGHQGFEKSYPQIDSKHLEIIDDKFGYINDSLIPSLGTIEEDLRVREQK